jgi:hypothetical protein
MEIHGVNWCRQAQIRILTNRKVWSEEKL